MLLDHVKRTIDFYHLLNKDDRVIVGVSGGVDSMVLLHLLNTYRHEFNLFLVVAYVNHGLRPEESEKEEELVRRESDRFGLPFEYGKFNVKEFKKVRGLSPQDAARKIRFHFLFSLFHQYRADKIALGHNADDQVETVLMRMIRGSGLKGLRGMLPIRERRVIRPLLEVWRKEIESYAKEEGISYLIDSSNLKESYLRNRLRLSLIPLIEKEYQPNLKEIILKTSTVLREEDDCLESTVDEVYQKMVQEEEGSLSFRLKDYQSLHEAIQWRIIQRMLGRICRNEMMVEEREWGNIDQIYNKLRQPPACFISELPQGICFEKRYDLISLERKKIKQIAPFEIELSFPGRTFIQEIGKEVVIEEVKREVVEGDIKCLSDVAFLDYQKLQFPLKARNFRSGDRFQPLGVNGAQKVKKFFIDHKIPKFERPCIPLLISGEMVIWVVGYRIDERVKITENTKRVLRVTII